MEERRVQATPHSWDDFMPDPLFPGGLIIKDHEVEVLLYWAAAWMDKTPCPLTECDRCDRAHRFWWEWCNSLHGANRVRLQRELRRQGIPLPPHPGDEVGNPTT